MKNLPIHLALSDQEAEQLKSLNKKLIDHIEEGFGLKRNALNELQDLLSKIVAKQPDLIEIFYSIKNSGEKVQVHLMHDDNEILNLPWSYAIDPVSNRTLGAIPEMMISKCLPDLYHPQQEDVSCSSPPLKVLVMISSPEDSDLKSLLSYEEEELEILQAFQPLMKTGLIQVDFTNDGSLEELRRKVSSNAYHILHISGHALFKNNTGYLMLEQSNTLNTEIVEAAEFAEVLNSNPNNKIPIVVLASCQTAQGNNEKGLQGVTNQLLSIGVPVVISMGMSILDKYATYFTAQVYENIVKKLSINEAFHKAIDAMRVFEYETRQKKEGELNIVPLQWIIPNLYMSKDFDFPVTWDYKEEKLNFTSQFVYENDRLILKHDKSYLFIGRRKDKAKIMYYLLERKPVFIRGQGGVGKTSMAEHLIQRLIAADTSIHPFIFSEKTTSLKDIQDHLIDFLIGRGNLSLDEILQIRKWDKRDSILTFEQSEKEHDKFETFKFLISHFNGVCKPVFLFDNLDFFQENPDMGFSDENQELKEIIDLLAEYGGFYIILTGRYTIPGFEYAKELNLSQVGLNDFWKKCQYLPLGKMFWMLGRKESTNLISEMQDTRPPSFADIVELLYKSLGGNYRALETFDKLVRQDQVKFEKSLLSLEDFQRTYQNETEEVRAIMSQDLLFGELLSLLSTEEKKLLALLSNFRIPVQETALDLQMDRNSTKEQLMECLLRLFDITLIELSVDVEIETSYCYVTTIIKEFLGQLGQIEDMNAFSHDLAGKYYYYNSSNLTQSFSELEEAFYHYHHAKNNTRLEVLGNRLSKSYYNVSLYHSAHYYAFNSYQQLGMLTSFDLLNLLGRIMYIFGDYDHSIEFYKKAHYRSQEIGDKSGEGTTLNNISQIYQSRGDYDTALEYLLCSLRINQIIGDKSGEGTTLNNISQIYLAHGDYDTALEYLERSLLIHKEVGNKNGEGAVLNNIASTAFVQGNHDTALERLERTLRMSQEIGNKIVEGATLSNISQIYQARGDNDTALEYLERSLRISQEIGDKKGEGTMLNNIATSVYERGDYDTALEFLMRSLSISQEIGDKYVEGTTLYNISGIYQKRGDYSTALEYLERSLLISQEIGDKSGEGTTLNSIGLISDTQRDYDTAFEYLESSLRLCQEIGDKSKEGTVLANIGNIYSALKDYKTALEYLERSLCISQEIGDKSVEGTILYNISQIYDALRDYDTTLEYLEQTLRILQEVGHKTKEGTVLANIGDIYSARKDYKTALEYMKRSLRVSQEIGDKKGEGTMLNNIGMTYDTCGDSDTALEYLERSLSISQEFDDTSVKGTMLYNISGIYQARGNYDTALEYLERSLQISKEIGDKSREVTALNDIGLIYDTHGNYKTALEYMERSLHISQEIGDKSKEGTVLANIGNIYSAHKDYKTALEYLELSLRITQEIGDKSGMITILHKMSSIAFNCQDTARGIEYCTAAYQLAGETNDAIGLFNVGQMYGQILFMNGKKEEGISVLKQSYAIGKQAGFPGLQEMATLIQQLENQ